MLAPFLNSGSIIGTLLELSGSSQVTCNGQVLSFKQALSYYEREYPGFVQSGTFVWTDTEGNSFTNTVSINPIGYPSNLDTLSRNQSFELVWTGDLLANNQNVTLTVNGENEADLQIFFQDDLNSHSIILEKNKLQNLVPDQAKCTSTDEICHPCNKKQALADC